MAQKSNRKIAEEGRWLVFSALGRQRAVRITHSGKSITIQKGVRFGNMDAPVIKQLLTEELAAEEAQSEIENYIDAGFKEFDTSLASELCFSCADDDMRGYLSAESEGGALAAMQVDSSEQKKNEGVFTLGQRAADLILSNTELKRCKRLQLFMPQADLEQTIKILSERKASLGIETLILKTARLSDINNPQKQSTERYCGDDDYDDFDGTWTSVPCDCFINAFPKVQRLQLIGGCWRLEGECATIEEIEAERLLTPSIRLKKLKRLKYDCVTFDFPIEEIDTQLQSISSATILAACCPKLESLDINIEGDIDTLEDFLTSPLCRRLTYFRIGAFSGMHAQKLFLLLTRFIAPLSMINDLTLVLEMNHWEKADIDRLKAFPLPLKLEFSNE